MKTNKTESKKPFKIEVRIPELELIKLLNNYGYSIHKDYSITSYSYDISFSSTLDITLIDCSQLES